MRRGLSQLSLLSLSAALASPSLAQQADPQAAAVTQTARTTAYDAAFFTQYAPQNALDIARQVPGFALDLGNVDTRGFAGAAGNVVINGSRPSSKAETLQTTLARIPAQRVVRVEVGPGDVYGAEYAGKSQVLNVILSSDAGIDGNVTASARRLYTGKLVPDVSASALIRRGASSINISAGTGNVLNLEEGTDTLTDPQTGELVEFRRKHNSYHDFNPYVSASWAMEEAADKAIRINGRWSPGQFDLTQRNHVVPTGDAERDDDLLQDFDNPVFELGGDITRPLAGGAIKLVGLATRRKRDWLERYRFRIDGETLGGFEQLQDAKRNETILRLNWTRSNLAGFSFEAGAEGALNTLDHRVQFSEILPGGELDPIDLPVDDATVREKRGEAYVRLGRQLSKSVRLDGGVTYEYSKLKVRGDTTADRKLMFWKPNLTLDVRGRDGLHGQLSVRRTVAQLDFYDFISAAELSADRVNGGNPNLLPQRAWEFRATVEKPILGDGLAKLDVGYDRISLLQDRVLIFDDKGKGFDSPGNIGTGTRKFARLTIDAPLTRFGIKGARLKLTGGMQRTRVEDPIDGTKRNFTGDFPDWDWNVDYRHDIGKFSYGFVLSDRDRITFFRTDELDINFNGGPFATAFVEYRPTPRTTITLDLDNALETAGQRRRIIFDPNRSEPPPAIDEFRERNRHLNFGLTLKRSFGGGGGAAATSPG
jgi:hypothetical protein